MIIPAISSLTIIPANWFDRYKVSYSAGSSFEFSSPPRKLFSLRADTYQNNKDLVPCFESLSSRVLRYCLANHVMATVESTDEANARSRLLKNIAVPDYLDPTASYQTISRKEKNPQKLSSRASQIKKLDHHLVIKYPIVTESAMKAILENNTLVFVVDKLADKNAVKDAVRSLFQVKAEKVNTLNLPLPDGMKKAFIRLRPDYNAVDVAKKIRIL